MKKNNAIPWWGWLAWVLTITLGILAYTHLPAHVAIGKAHRMKPRLFLVWYVPTIMLVIIFLWQVLWRIDPKKKNYESFWPTYRYIGGVIIVCIGLIYLAIIGYAFRILSIRFIPTVWGIMFMLMANVLPRIQPNWFVGVRTPWTLSSAQSWNRTQRLGGQLGIPIGLLAIVLAWILPTNSLIKLAIFSILAPVLLWALITAAASYFFFAKKG